MLTVQHLGLAVQYNQRSLVSLFDRTRPSITSPTACLNHALRALWTSVFEVATDVLRPVMKPSAA